MSEELLTVQEFADKFRVSTATVRWWIKMKYVDYEMKGARKLVKRSSAVHFTDEEQRVQGEATHGETTAEPRG